MINLFGGSIKKQVMASINERIKNAQKEHDQEVSELKKNLKAEKAQILKEGLAKLDEANNLHKTKKVQVAEKHVSSILNKLI